LPPAARSTHHESRQPLTGNPFRRVFAANAYRKLGVHGAAAAVHAHRDVHFSCGTRVDFGPIRERLKASRSTSTCPMTASLKEV